MYQLYGSSLFKYAFFSLLFLMMKTIPALANNTYLFPGIYSLQPEQLITTTPQIQEKPTIDLNQILDGNKEIIVSYDKSTRNNQFVFMKPITSTQHSKNICQGYFIGGESDNASFCYGGGNIKIQSNKSFSFSDNTQYIFRLNQPKHYLNSIKVSENTKLYTKPISSSAYITFPTSVYIFITHENLDWYEVNALNDNGQLIHGWIDRDTFLKTPWIDQKQTTKKYKFQYALYSESYEQNYAAIKILDKKTGKQIQIIWDIPTDSGHNVFYEIDNVEDQDEIKKHFDDEIDIVDANFDGYPDLMLWGFTGGAGPNDTRNIILYNPTTHKFEWNQALSQLPQIEINPKDKTISSANRGSCCSYLFQTFKFVKNKLILVKSSTHDSDADGNITDTTDTLIRGKWHHKIEKYKDNP